MQNNLLNKLRKHAGIYSENNQVIVDPERASPINWKRVHRLPDHVRFVHSAHINYLTNNPDAIKNIPAHLNIYEKENVSYRIVHSLDGYDEISLTGQAKIISPKEEYLLQPNKITDKVIKAEHLHGGKDIQSSAKLFTNILEVSCENKL